MLVGIINKQSFSYYIYQENEMLDIIKVGFNKYEHLSKEDIITLFGSIFKSDLTYFKSENGYQIYLDESGNKRYHMNDLEDFNMFFSNNGYSVLFFEELQHSEDSTLKKFVIKHKNIVTVLLIDICFVSIITDFALLHKSGLSKKPESEIFTFVNGKLTVEDINDYINNSSLSSANKELLKNTYLIEDVINSSIYNDTLRESDVAIRNYELYEKFNGISIQEFSRNDVNALGYYNPLKPSNIYVCDDIDCETGYYQDVLTHEFIHLLQVSGYSYIIESCAEIMSYEYFNCVPDGYKEEMKRMKVLMEIIGSDVVFNYNFINNDKSLFDEIKKYLSENDYKRLIELFKTTPEDWGVREKEINDEIDQILSLMYFNKFKKDITENKLIKLIYQGNNEMNIESDRIYFNKRHEKYNKAFCAEVKKVPLDTIDLSEVLNGNCVAKCRYYRLERFDDDSYVNPLNNPILWQNIIYEPAEDVLIYDIDGKQKLGFIHDSERYTPSEALEKGMIIRKIEVCYSEETTNFELLKAKKYGNIEIELNDESICKFVYNQEKGWFTCVERYMNVNVMYPPVNTKQDITEEKNNGTQRTKK